MIMIVMKIKVLFQNTNIHLMIIFLLKEILDTVTLLNYDEVTQGRTDDNNSSDDNELSYSLKLISDFGKHKNTFLYNYTNIERATKTYTNASKNYYGYRDSINFIGEYNFNLDNKLLYGLDHEFDEANFRKTGLQII